MEEIDTSKLNEKTINNALSCYFLIIFSLSFLFLKKDKNINNSFVKSHVKSAFIIHLGFIITYIIFISNSLFSSIYIFGFQLNHIITRLFFLGFFALLLIGMYKAKNKQLFLLKNVSFVTNNNILDINNDNIIDEKDKLTIILSFIPFIGFLNYAKYKTNIIIQNATKLNLIISLIIFALYFSGHTSLSSLFLLVYCIYIIFVGINIFVKSDMININLQKVPTSQELIIIISSLKKYFINYIKDKKFVELSDIIREKTELLKTEEIEKEAKLKKLETRNIPSFLFYIPILNFVFLFIKKSKYKYHIINGITLNLIIIILVILNFFNYYNSNIYLFLFIPICFGIGYSYNQLAYKMPFVYQTYEFLVWIKNLFIFNSKKINEKRKEVNEVSFKVGEKK